ncbi:MAG: hypothetical protein GX951_04175 [Mollicutes bacterium]|nr:hypothetical protein [Mollicutes bacterium]
MIKLSVALFVNLLTALRIIGAIFLVPLYLKKGALAAASLSMICYFTDFLDGIIARKAKVSTFFGSVFDGTADKLFTVANLILLVTMTKYAVFPILCELAIFIIQTIRYSKNANVKSSKTGKFKTIVISMTVILIYLVIDIKKITFLNANFINYVTSLDQVKLLGTIFMPLYIFEILTLASYLVRFRSDKEVIQESYSDIDIKLKKPKSFKDKFYNFRLLWLNNDIYEKYKDSAGLKGLREFVKKNR